MCFSSLNHAVIECTKAELSLVHMGPEVEKYTERYLKQRTIDDMEWTPGMSTCSGLIILQNLLNWCFLTIIGLYSVKKIPSHPCFTFQKVCWITQFSTLCDVTNNTILFSILKIGTSSPKNWCPRRKNLALSQVHEQSHLYNKIPFYSFKNEMLMTNRQQEEISHISKRQRGGAE